MVNGDVDGGMVRWVGPKGEGEEDQMFTSRNNFNLTLDIHHTVLTSALIFASCRDCPSYLTSAETVRDLLLPAETVVLGK